MKQFEQFILDNKPKNQKRYACSTHTAKATKRRSLRASWRSRSVASTRIESSEEPVGLLEGEPDDPVEENRLRTTMRAKGNND